MTMSRTHTTLGEVLARIVRAPFFVISLVISIPLALFFLAWVSVGAWCEDGMRWLGYRARPRGLPAVVGFVMYVGLGIAAPTILGWALLGWPGAVLGPVLALGAIVILGHW
jgi:hypothetical protein